METVIAFVVGFVLGGGTLFFWAKNNKEDLKYIDEKLDEVKNQVGPTVREGIDDIKNVFKNVK